MGNLIKALVVVAVVAVLATPALAQFGGFGGGGMGALLQNTGVQKEVKLSDDQIKKVTEALEKVRGDMRDDLAKLREKGTKPEQRAEITKKLNEANEKALGGILKEEQMKRLKQIDLQNSGITAFSNADVQKKLTLTNEQKDKFKAMGEEFGKEMREIFQGAAGDFQGAQKKIAALRTDTVEKAVKTLTADQKKMWKEMTGEPFEVKFEPRRPNP